MRELLTEKYIPPTYIHKDGTFVWKNKYGDTHRDGDKPALIKLNGDKFWFKNGEYYREGDKPSAIFANGDKFWLKNGQHHREGDKPAIIFVNGYKAWCQNGEFHRDGDKPTVITSNGDKVWIKNGEYIKSETKLQKYVELFLNFIKKIKVLKLVCAENKQQYQRKSPSKKNNNDN